ncbi:hypothetical protein NMK71_07380 [Weeksellaceae bacterium KMM 9713]|uniref:Uncharacterized protein n=1 Tax=Profundicola chukchiensis TaxID=2961959 RepID=A0A9X4RVV9_9FLAO|nr:hypothetical protein [Profundicola chukchiensis]MDG4946230.1 hypothetical protein [Profundicola chukchiensis]
MKKSLVIILSISLLCLLGLGTYINSKLNELEEAFKVEHNLQDPHIILLEDSISPNRKFKYYAYQFDNGGLGYSRVFWSVIENNDSLKDLVNGLIPTGYKIKAWSNENELILEKWKPYYESDPAYELDGIKRYNGVDIRVVD